MEVTLQNTFLYPWKHWIVDNFLNEQCLLELKSVPFQNHQMVKGKRTGSQRLFVTEKNKDQYPELFKLYKSLQSGDYKEFFENSTGTNFDNLHVRVEVVSDFGEFELDEHCDRPEKKLSAMVYTDYEELYPGTMLKENYQIESKDNRCFFFIPNEDTLHSYPRTNFTKVRRCLMINYWTYAV
jgi:hypothetical protein